ncbi:MAG: cupin domain-containing protein [Elusimicrobia bacterium]|nr:cupin domain-containing protein [Elusimicrobiota bacterium]
MKNGPAETVPKPWGRELIFAKAPKYVGKILVIEKGHRLSLQYHRKKHESLYVLRGRLGLRLGRTTRIVGPGSAFSIPPGTIHRFEAPKGRVTLIEVSTPEIWDVVRLKDDYGRGEK